ncbi:MAG: hypothetical protein A4E73_00584 [Syntrophaceae bacterium PtaU1.Bin231]|nr:MAG: hypothetical protein A4E73_00584 [Syntrophaceae bacterium PtaU1.Bin231]
MKSGHPSQNPPGQQPIDVLQEFVGVFVSKGWLNQTIRIRHRGGRYSISCSEKQFFAYRINDNCSVSPGFPGWPVCIVTHDRMTDDAAMSSLASTEPDIREWLRCFRDGDFELI